jgi:hypothetical protein
MSRTITRRSFCVSTLGAVAAGPLAQSATRASGAVKAFEPDFGTAVEALRAIRNGEITCYEPVDHVYDRIEKHNSDINAFLTLNEEGARKEAEAADQLLARGGRSGRLQGLPILIKDTFETAGIRTTCGSKTLEDRVPTQDALPLGDCEPLGQSSSARRTSPSSQRTLRPTMKLQALPRIRGTLRGHPAVRLAAARRRLPLGLDFSSWAPTSVAQSGH